MNKKILIVIVSTFLIIFSSGCVMQPTMKAPKLSTEQEEVSLVLKNLLNSKSRLTNIVSGQNKNAIQFIDLDGDKSNEVIAFYTTEAEQEPLRCIILRKNNNKWEKSDEIRGYGYGFDKVIFKDLTGDGKSEIIIGWKLGESLDKGINIYQYNNGKIKELFTNSYQEAIVEDLDNDSIAEIVLLQLNRNELKASSQLFKYSMEKIKLVNEVKMDGGINRYAKIEVGNASIKQTGIFVECELGAHSANTDLLIIKNGKLKSVFFDEQQGFTEKTFKSYAAFSQDIDNDEIIEIPLLRPSVGYEKASMAETKWITTWNKWDGGNGLTHSNQSYENYNDGYYFIFPSKWDKSITIESDKENINSQWISFNFKNSGSVYELFRIYTFDINDWDKIQKESKGKNQEYVEIMRNLNKVYTVTIHDKYSNKNKVNEMLLNIEEIKANLRVIK